MPSNKPDWLRSRMARDACVATATAAVDADFIVEIQRRNRVCGRDAYRGERQSFDDWRLAEERRKADPWLRAFWLHCAEFRRLDPPKRTARL